MHCDSVTARGVLFLFVSLIRSTGGQVLEICHHPLVFEGSVGTVSIAVSHAHFQFVAWVLTCLQTLESTSHCT